MQGWYAYMQGRLIVKDGPVLKQNMSHLYRLMTTIIMMAQQQVCVILHKHQPNTAILHNVMQWLLFHNGTLLATVSTHSRHSGCNARG